MIHPRVEVAAEPEASELDDERNPEPHEVDYATGKGWAVHWTGYVLDPQPTADRRAQGESVGVYHEDPRSCELRLLPTALPGIPEPWASRFLAFGVGNAKVCGGPPGQRFISNGHWQARVDEATFDACVRAGWLVCGDKWYEPAVLPKHRVALSFDVPAKRIWGYPQSFPDEGQWTVVNYGGAWIQERYESLLYACGVSEVVPVDVGGEMPRIVAPGVAVVMCLRKAVGEDVQRQGGTAARPQPPYVR